MKRWLWLLVLCATLTQALRPPTINPTNVRIVNIHPHNTSSFTEGLFMLDGSFIESTGLPRYSFIREYRLKNRVYYDQDDDKQFLNEYQYEPALFGEGIACIGNTLYALTYKAKKILVLSRDTFKLQSVHPFTTSTGEGWGMTTDGTHLIVSDGSSKIQFYDPTDNKFTLVRTLNVTLANGTTQWNVNELEYVDNELLANVWYENRVLRISLKDGHVIEDISLNWLTSMVSNLQTEEMKSNPQRVDAVMNGIAYDPSTRHVFITGKWWDSLFELEFSYLKHHSHKTGTQRQ